MEFISNENTKYHTSFKKFKSLWICTAYIYMDCMSLIYLYNNLALYYWAKLSGFLDLFRHNLNQIL